MKLISQLGNVPKPVAVLAAIEMNANYTVKRKLHQEGEELAEVTPTQCFPILVECSSVEELDSAITEDPDIDKQLLVDKETGRLYMAAIGQVGRMKITGSGEEDEAFIDQTIIEQDKSVIYFTEVKKDNTIITISPDGEESGGGSSTNGVRDPGGNADKELRSF